MTNFYGYKIWCRRLGERWVYIGTYPSQEAAERVVEKAKIYDSTHEVKWSYKIEEVRP